MEVVGEDSKLDRRRTVFGNGLTFDRCCVNQHKWQFNRTFELSNEDHVSQQICFDGVNEGDEQAGFKDVGFVWVHLERTHK